MGIYNNFFLFIFIFILVVSRAYGKDDRCISNNRVMTIDEFVIAINNNKILKKLHQTTMNVPLDEHEIELISLAIQNQNASYGGKCYPGRNINDFTGDTLFVGGGRFAGERGENDGKTVLINIDEIVNDINMRISYLRKGVWASDRYIGRNFESNKEKEKYIDCLQKKRDLYREAFQEKNNDIINKYYTLNIEKNVNPDMIASITSIEDTQIIPDNKFEYVEFENVPCDVFLDPNLYKVLERITKPEGKIKLSISHACKRLVIPVISDTKYGPEFIAKIQAVMYSNIENMNETYGSYDIEVSNVK